MTTPLQVTSQSKEAEIDRSPVKIVLLGVFGVGMSLLVTHFFRSFLATMLPSDFLIWLFAVAAFLIAVALQMVFVKSGGKLSFMMFLNGIAPLAFFTSSLFPNPSVPLLIGAGLFILFLVIGAERGWRILSEGMVVRFGLAVRNMLPKAVTGMLIFLSAVSYLSYFTLHEFSAAAGRNLFDASLTYAAPVVRLWFPNVSFDQPTSEFFKQVAKSEIATISTSELSNIMGGAALNFSALPAPTKEKLINEAAAKVQEAFAAKYGSVSSDEPMRDTLYRIVTRYAGDISTNMGPAFAVAVTALIFFTLRGFFSLILWLIGLLAFLVYKFLVITGFAYVSIESRSREFIILS